MTESEVGFSFRPYLGTSVWRKLLGSLAFSNPPGGLKARLALNIKRERIVQVTGMYDNWQIKVRTVATPLPAIVTLSAGLE